MDPVLAILNDHMYVVVISIIALAVLANASLRALTLVLTTQARERSRREIAAYIAEGSITPEQGERLMAADVRGGRQRACC